MRLRNKPWAHEKMLAHPHYVVHEPEKFRGHFNELFQKEQPIHLEIGSGKGQFIIEMAKRHPDINFIAYELQTSVALLILEKQIEEALPNLQIINKHGRHLEDFFAPGEIDRIYLNFSDPWPKARHAKRRLTSPRYLKLYREVLKDQGELHFKTDNQPLFEYSLVTIPSADFTLKEVSLDLHEVDDDSNVMTEYEERFANKGHPIYKLEAVKK